MGIPVFFASHIPSRRFALGNRIHWLCRPAGANQTRTWAAFPPPSRSRVRAREPNSLALPAGRREPKRPRAGGTAPMLAWSDEEARACGEQGANRKGRALGKRRLCWRGPTEEQGLGRCKAPTGKVARRKKGAGVGVARRRNKGLRDARRQHGRPRAEKKAPGLAWPDEGTRACREGGANMEGRALRKRRQGWRGPTEEQGLGRCKAPTWKAARPESGIEKELPPQLFSSY